jgi:hypothetical protein
MGLTKAEKKERLVDKVINCLGQLEDGGGPDKFYAICKELETLFTKNKGYTKELELVASVLKNEMRAYYKSRHLNQKKEISLKLNQLLLTI